MELTKPAVTHIIFDFDGLLVDTEPCYTIANQAILGKYGREFTTEMKGRSCAMSKRYIAIVPLAKRKAPHGSLVHIDTYMSTQKLSLWVDSYGSGLNTRYTPRGV
ncbi:hypothetical protein Aduo_006079 [Ancylostoma duodenale]